MKEHPFDLLKLKVDEEVWVKARIIDLSEKGTLGYAQGWVNVRLESDGLLGEQKATVKVTSLGRMQEEK